MTAAGAASGASWAARLAARRAWEPPERRGGGRALAVTAHPDDEVLALGGVLVTLAARGWAVDLLVLTDGEASYPGLGADAGRRLAAVRRAELDAAWQRLGLAERGRVLRAGLPDTRLPEVEEEVRSAVVRAAAAGGAPDLVLGLWEHDPHRDHACAARAAAALAAELGVPSVRAPLWARVWWASGDERVPWGSVTRVPLGEEARERLSRALAAHASQVVGFEGAGPLLAPGALTALAGDGLVVVP
ncbi:PIG-L deacetylase family protein [uncultured Pseudokineococcus sp.]|uniref:PIG-L deacetylase family protein n=1 Tax=uncultured Pseudokineococcus sp. TaxID=1642928 RepID=UPI00261126C1|nr:PIG-L family deacetylase [uncultured Pseudokineococcus sp.]